jgi:hypothetical protein
MQHCFSHDDSSTSFVLRQPGMPLAFSYDEDRNTKLRIATHSRISRTTPHGFRVLR